MLSSIIYQLATFIHTSSSYLNVKKPKLEARAFLSRGFFGLSRTKQKLDRKNEAQPILSTQALLIFSIKATGNCLLK